jgi:hypothetical protein
MNLELSSKKRGNSGDLSKARARVRCVPELAVVRSVAAVRLPSPAEYALLPDCGGIRPWSPAATSEQRRLRGRCDVGP